MRGQENITEDTMNVMRKTTEQGERLVLRRQYKFGLRVNLKLSKVLICLVS